MGEVVAIAPVVNGLMQAHPEWKFVLSTATETGLKTAFSVFPKAVHIVQMPFDFRFCIRRILTVGTPFLVILSEGDVWPVFLHEARAAGAKVVLCNGKISDKTIGRLGWVPFFGRWLYSFVDLFCLQNQTFYDRFVSLGIDRTKIRVTGSTKADVNISLLTEEENRSWKKRLGISEKDKVIIVGSSHEPEEQQIVSSLMPILERDSACKLMIVPRHPERFDSVIAALPGPVARYSSYVEEAPWNIMVVDQVGMLTLLYQLSDLAIVAGSFVERIGGHNILEPAAVGVPVIVGPYMHSQRALFESACDAHAVTQVDLKGLCSTVDAFLHDDDLRRKRAQEAFTWAEMLRGATQRTLEVLSSFQ